MVEGQQNLASRGESLKRIHIFIEKYGGKGVLKDGSSVVWIWMCYFLLVFFTVASNLISTIFWVPFNDPCSH